MQCARSHKGSFKIARSLIEYEAKPFRAEDEAGAGERLTEKIVVLNAGYHPQTAVQAAVNASTTIVKNNLVQPSGVDQ